MADAYKRSGVNIDAGNELVDRIKPALGSNRTSDMLSGLGGFAALCRVPEKFTRPVMVLGTDGVGTKLDLLLQHDQLDTVGQDLVAMCANDVLVYGAEPTLFLDYYATEKLDVDEAETVIKSIAEACDIAGCALVGGETAEMPGFYPDGKFDLAGFCVGWVEEDEILKPERVQAGDAIIGLASSGPHSNGFSLIRKLLSELEVTPSPKILSALLAPTRIYAKSLLPLMPRIRAMAHITGGGFKDNLPRAFSNTLEAHIDPGWLKPYIFSWLQDQLSISRLEMLETFNCGIGMVLFVDPTNSATVSDELAQAGETPYLIGQVHPQESNAQAGTLVVSRDRFELV
ncbi:MAG: phosphoribosylformylglycinamidine cyclo-ligase [Gammaproteobacteria bacterium]|nr:phosphoribosylformylglycinamidine cyclo-ligase [Gammaproteobacteria bacterium]